MRTTLTSILGAALLAGVALGQGAGGNDRGIVGDAIHDQLRKDSLAGPGFVQNDFLSGLAENLQSQFGEERGQELYDNLKDEQLGAGDLVELMNGDATKSELQDYFDCGQSDLPRLEAAVEETVEDKDRKICFGVIVFIMVIDLDCDPKGDFCQQIAGAQEEISDENFEKLCKGNVSTKVLGECFGLESKDDMKFMQEVLNALMSSAFVQHPLAKSLGMGKEGQYDRSQFPKLGEGMPGFGGEYDSGTAGGFPFDKGMPPCPYMGDNMDSLFPDAGSEAGD
ncbi:MAG: hypothetical protein ACREID_03950 [Planctomycetota bacterium]